MTLLPTWRAGLDAEVVGEDEAVVAVVFELLEWLLDPQAAAIRVIAISPTAASRLRPEPTNGTFILIRPVSLCVWLRL